MSERSYNVSFQVSVTDEARLHAVAREAGVRNGFETPEEYDQARASSGDPVRYDLMEIWPTTQIEAGNGIVIGDMDAEETR